MRHHSAMILALLAAAVVTLSAQKTTQVHPGAGGSPHVRSEWLMDGANISIEYGRPFLKGRPESQMMPQGKPWRTGADEATTLKIDRPLTFGTLAVSAGMYTLYTVPGAREWRLIISKRTGQVGIPYPEGEDLGRVAMKLGTTAAPVEQLTISIDDTPSGATLRIEWGRTSASVPFTIG